MNNPINPDRTTAYIPEIFGRDAFLVVDTSDITYGDRGKAVRVIYNCDHLPVVVSDDRGSPTEMVEAGGCFYDIVAIADVPEEVKGVRRFYKCKLVPSFHTLKTVEIDDARLRMAQIYFHGGCMEGRDGETHRALAAHEYAMELVHQRHSKTELVSLVSYLLYHSDPAVIPMKAREVKE